MPFANIAVRQAKGFAPPSPNGSTVTATLDNAVLAGSTLVVLGTAVVGNSGDAAAYTRTLLSSVNDTSSNTWGTPTNVNGGLYAPNVFGVIAQNVAAASPTVTLNLSNSSTNQVSYVLAEITAVPTTNVLDQNASASSNAATATIEATTATLAQTDNLVLLVAGGYLGTPVNPAGWTSHHTTINGQNGTVGCQVSSKKVTTTTAVTGTVTHDNTGGWRSILMLVLKASSDATRRYKFQFDTATMTSADTGITGFVFRNGDPDVVLAEKYTGLAGSATAGDLLITSIPSGAAVTDTVKGIFFNGTDTSGLVTGTVENV